MRALALCLTLLASSATAWEFSPTPICTLAQTRDGVSVEVTYDHGTELYAIEITRPGEWPRTPGFTITFEGPRGLTIGTDRHSLSADARTLRVEDTGFGNVLDGIAFNRVARARAGAAEVAVPLDGAAEPMAAFRACTGPLAV